jgi:enterochelin esterase-like enzyme
LKYVKIRSTKLSEFWNRDMYVGANVLLPHGYVAGNSTKRYPVVYQQGHWPAGGGAFRYPIANFSTAWDSGVIPGVSGQSNRTTPKMILVTFRHEAPFYDDSYGVNTANMGPYGDAINDELIPHIDATFNTIAEPWARVQEGGSTGGWISAASVIYRPDLFGACFSSYPDSLDFRSHQDIPLYNSTNAYYRPDGTAIGSIRTFENETEVVLATVAQENHWELTFGTSSRSALQWE